MREILFRGKQVKDGKWTEGYYCPKPYSHFPCEPTIFPFDTINKDWHGERVDPETVGQYTGLTDKNGRKIFEGDIVKTHYANAKKTDFVETVVFHNGKFCAFHSNNDCKQWTVLYDGVKHLAIDKSVYMDGVEIIGNIYDNPELMEGGANNG